VAQALAKQYSHVLIDERAHGCLADAAVLLGCPVIKFRHRDADDLARILKPLGNGKPIVLTDGMFSHDGGIIPLKKYLAALPKNGTLLLDDAHGAGVLGKTGRGTPQEAGVSSKQIIQTITLSKAFGVYGGAVLGSNELRSAIIARSRLFVGNTPLPLPLANAALKSIAILKSHPGLRTRLIRNTTCLKHQLAGYGWRMEKTPGPIIALIPKDPEEAKHLKRRLLAERIYPSFIKYPGGPESGYFRFAISSEHTQPQLDALLRALTAKETV
jgi:8-amino-7-oxononanoate synthase